MEYKITELLGDGIASELSAAVRIVSAALPCKLNFEPVDLSLPNREKRGASVYDEAVESMTRNRFSLKYPTITSKESPNAVLRKRCDFSVIHRPVYTIPGVPTNFRQELSLNIIRVAHGGTYDDPGRPIGTEAAVSLRIVERQPCWEAARYAFMLARRSRKTVTSASKRTIQAATDGLFASVVNEVAQEFLDVLHQEELFDALLAKVIMHPERYSVILVLNEYGDFLSDMACGLAGSMGIGASASEPRAGMECRPERPDRAQGRHQADGHGLAQHGGDIAAIIPDLIDTEHPQVNANLNYKGGRGSLQGGYYASIFSNNVTSMNWQNWAAGATHDEPDEQRAGQHVPPAARGGAVQAVPIHPGWSRTAPTRATRRTMPSWSMPRRPSSRSSSLNGLVVSTALGAKLTSRRHKVSLIAAYRYDDRDNRTGVHIYPVRRRLGRRPSPMPASRTARRIRSAR